MFRLASAIAAIVLLFPFAGASAQSWPSQPITMIVSFPPGGATDLVGRQLASEMSKVLNQSVVVANRAGAAGTIGSAAIANAPGNGYTFGFVVSAALTVVPHLQKVPYQLDSFQYLCRTFDIPVYALVTADSRFKSMRELISYARANPGKLNYASVGIGSLPHMAGLDLERAAGIKMNHVPYKGEGPAVIDLLGKHVDLLFGTNAVASTHRLRRLAAASEKRAADLPDVPTLAEMGYNVSWSIVGGAIAPQGIDPVARSGLEKACATAAATPAFQQALVRMNVVPLYADGATYRDQLIRDIGRNRVLIKDSGLLAQ